MENLLNQLSYIEQSVPVVQVPAIKFMQNGRYFFVQMNLKSIVVEEKEKRRYLHQGFLFKVQSASLSAVGEKSLPLVKLLETPLGKKSKPEILLVSGFPTLFHPHFTMPKVHLSGVLSDGRIKWVDYIEEATDEDIGAYILRVARSLIYQDEYVDPNARKIGNPKALRFYEEKRYSNPDLFPTDSLDLSMGESIKTYEYDSPKPKFFLTQSEDSRKTVKKVRFEVQESKPAYSPSSRTKPDLEIVRSLDSDFRTEPGSSLGYEFYVTMSAFRTIGGHIAWGTHTRENVVEQGGILMGHAYRNPNSGVVYAIAEQAVSGRLARGTAGYLEITHETWKEMLDNVDRMQTGLQLIGWYHTHPNSLDVFMSGTDRSTQRRLFGNDWQFAIVLNPHKQIWRSFYGSDSRECRGYVLSDDPTLTQRNRQF